MRRIIVGTFAVGLATGWRLARGCAAGERLQARLTGYEADYGVKCGVRRWGHHPAPREQHHGVFGTGSGVIDS